MNRVECGLMCLQGLVGGQKGKNKPDAGKTLKTIGKEAAKVVIPAIIKGAIRG